MRLFWKGNDITNSTTTVTWEGSARQAARTITFGVAYSPEDPRVKPLDIQNGDEIFFYPGWPYNKTVVFAGKVTARERKGEAGELSYTAKDGMHHLLESRGTYRFENKTPEKIASVACKDVQVPVGSLAKTKVPIPKIFFEDRPYYEIIMAAYTEAHKRNKKKYIAQMNGAKLDVIEKGKVIPDFHLKQGEWITASSYAETTEGMVNRVAIYNAAHEKIGSMENKEWVKKYGIFQSTVTAEEGNGAIEAKAELKGIDKQAGVECIGDIRCVSGRGVKVQDERSGLTGLFWIENDSHTWQGQFHSMSLTLAFQNLMDTYEGDEEATAQGEAGGVSGSALEEVLTEARKWLGTGEDPPGSNHNAITEYYGMNAAWCCMFIWTIFQKSGHGDLFMNGGKTAYCFDVMNWYKARGRFGSEPKPGALVIYGGSGHIGIVESVSGGGYVSIEGNLSDTVKRSSGPSCSAVLGFCYPNYPEPAQDASGQTLAGRRVRAKFTAYYPANNAMEGGFLDALGNRLDPSKNTMAVPEEVPLHSKIQIQGTGTERDGGVYEALDHGGAIKIESGNVYHFDILMASNAQCNAWGERMGYAVIGE